jgi:hypothetical protein
MNQNTAFQRLDSAQYLYLPELSEPHDNSLKLIVEEAVVNRSGVTTAMPELDIVLKDTAPIESVEGCATFELYWKHYAAHLVTEELVGSNAKNGYDDEFYTGKLLRVYSTSHFLDHIARDTGGHSEPLQHYKVVCVNHLIDVAAYAPPDVGIVELRLACVPKHSSWRNIAITVIVGVSVVLSG